MFLELIATIAGGLAGAGMMLLITRISAGRLPRWMVPIAAGIAMLAVTISNEYGWYGRTIAALPDGIEVVQTIEVSGGWRPWTWVVPFTTRFAAIDRASIRRNDAVPGQVIVDMLFYGRWSPVSKLPLLVDCDDARRAALTDDVQFGDTGTVTNADWVGIAADDPVLIATCQEG